MPTVAYRFLPYDDDGSPRENSNLTLICDEDENIGLGSVVDADLLGYEKWEVIEMCIGSGPLISARDADGDAIPLEGTLVCRGIR